MITLGPIESFFKLPTEAPSDQGDGVLYHLRRDLEKLYGKENDYTVDASEHAMLAMMGILAGIDYLSKVYSSKKHSREKFTDTLQNLCGFHVDAEAIYQLRCALVHSVSLSTVSVCSYRRGIKFIFEITDKAGAPLLAKLSDDGKEVAYKINFLELKGSLIKVIDTLRTICGDNSHPKHTHVINQVGQLHSEKIIKKHNA